MNQTAIFWPVIGHALLVFIVYVVLLVRRYRTVMSGQARAQQYKLRATEPEPTMTVANNLMNQFEAPVLFHVVCLAFHATAGVSYVVVTMAWLFVLSRYVHSWVHLSTNKLKHRNYAFRAGLVILFLMWLWFTLHLAGAI
jgi:hypothetical protein